MGCDIHCFVEKRTNKGWERVSKGLQSDYYAPNNEYFSTDEYKDGGRIIDCRNYTLFAFMANVRNGYGFAGCDTGDAIKPISMPKGLPSDVSEEVKKESDDWGVDGHSHSFLSLRELNEFDPEKVTKVYRGYIVASQYEDFLKEGRPSSYAGDMAGPSTIKSPNSVCVELQRMNPHARICTQVEWTEQLSDRLDAIYDHALPQLEKISSDGKGEDVRLVFWFDN
ncbi:MAG: hypothetical protein ACWA44_02735 [Thiotrichales bacterium]